MNKTPVHKVGASDRSQAEAYRLWWTELKGTDEKDAVNALALFLREAEARTWDEAEKHFDKAAEEAWRKK